MKEKMELNKNNSKRYSLELLQTQTLKFYQKYNLKENKENLIINKIKFSQLDLIENNIKNALNNMIIKIEKNQHKRNKKEYLSPKIKRSKMTCSPDLKFNC